MKKALLISISFLWCGLIGGISFLEAPLKFRAPNITLELGLGIGKLVFTALNRMELVLAILMIILLLATKAKRSTWTLFSIPIIVLFIQSGFLLPILNTRIDLILDGQQLAPTYHHFYYVIGEIIKFLTLLVGGIIYTKSVVE